jgi:hypothetical protein
MKHFSTVFNRSCPTLNHNHNTNELKPYVKFSPLNKFCLALVGKDLEKFVSGENTETHFFALIFFKISLS